jgi:uncharacterized protein YkwD
MSSLRILLLCLVVFGLAACGEAPVSPVAVPVSSPTTLSADLQTLFKLVNEARSVKRTCGTETFQATAALTVNTKLTKAAQKHSEDMELAGKLDHVSPSGGIHYRAGTTFDQRIEQEGYSYKSAGENIARGFNSPEAVMEAWLASPGHCRNVMKPIYTEIGLGKSGDYWTQEFATPQP